MRSIVLAAGAVVFCIVAGCQGPMGPAGKDGASGYDVTRYTLTPTVTTGGTISPAALVKVDSGNLQIFIVKPDIFYVIDSVTADGVRLQVLASSVDNTVKVLNVTKDMVVKAWFSRRPVYYGMKLISAGSFLMGTDSVSQTEGAVNASGNFIHRVTLSAFYMDTTEVTQAEYRGLMGVNPSSFRTGAGWASLPVEQVTWFDAVLYCNARSKTEGKDTVYSYSYIDGTPGNECKWLDDLGIDYAKRGYRLPTEAEWEYACRAGTTTNYYWESNMMDNYAWHVGNSSNTTHPVATKLSNTYGLYDMAGNVWEWCNDWNGGYTTGAVTNPTGVANGSSRVLRGGSWYNGYGSYVGGCRSAGRNNNDPDGRSDHLGFRVVLSR